MPPACCAPPRRERCREPRRRCAEGAARCGVDTVEIARIERLLAETPADELGNFFSAQELLDAGDGPGRAASLAARFAAKEACIKLFPREAALGAIGPIDFSVVRDGYGAPTVRAQRCRAAGAGPQPLQRHPAVADARPQPGHRHGAGAAGAGHALARGAAAVPAAAAAPQGGAGQPAARLRRRADDAEITRLAQAHYGHLGRLLWEFLWYPVAVARAQAGDGAGGEPRRAAGRACAGQGRADPHRPLRQFRGRHQRRAGELSRKPRAASTSCAGRSAPSGWTSW